MGPSLLKYLLPLKYLKLNVWRYYCFYSFLSAISRAVSTWLLLTRLFASWFILASKPIFINYSTKFRSSNKTCGARCFVFNHCGFYIQDFVARLVMSGIFFSTSRDFNSKLSLCSHNHSQNIWDKYSKPISW